MLVDGVVAVVVAAVAVAVAAVGCCCLPFPAVRENIAVTLLLFDIAIQGSANQPLINREMLLLLLMIAVAVCSSFPC